MIELLDEGSYYFARVAVRYGGRFVSKPGDIILGYESDRNTLKNVLTLMRKQPVEDGEADVDE